MNLLTRTALCCLAAISLAGCAALSNEATRLVGDVWADARPQLIPILSAAILGAAGVTVTAAGAWGAAAFKAIQRRELFAALYRGMDNGLKAAFARKLASGVPLPVNPAPGDVVKQALDYVKENGAREIVKLGQSDATLVEKLVARAPEAKAAVVTADRAAKAAVH
ncbi:hypothetical protein [Chenggangzhangella methanolivorans]|uniref:Uncharacterized protein n=2 Tax=Chenggangzhangella methanolivorans TaxID=1437009 RepID=A0A9E6R8Q0_9HYPH|nr:hypothetical protein [Chenggangzhangella methanolivorans]QZN99561.1 hypothetical protein K6K41_23095 [Chenggangzhangella methanolivorans]